MSAIRAAVLKVTDKYRTQAASSKPSGAGWETVPGGHGGYRKRTAKGYRYWYPSKEQAEASNEHHNSAANSLYRQHAEQQDGHKGTGIIMRPDSDPERQEIAKAIRDHGAHAKGANTFAWMEMYHPQKEEWEDDYGWRTHRVPSMGGARGAKYHYHEKSGTLHVSDFDGKNSKEMGKVSSLDEAKKKAAQHMTRRVFP